MRGQFALNLRAVVAGGAVQIELRIGQFICVQSQLRLGNIYIVLVDSGLCRTFCLACGGTGSLGQAIGLRLIVMHELIELRDLLRERQRLSRELAILCLQAFLAQRRGKSLIHFMIGKALGLARVPVLFRADGQRGQSLRRLPGAQIDQDLHASAGARRMCLRSQKRQMLHGVARGEGEDHAQRQHCEQRDKIDKPCFAKEARTNELAGAGRNRGLCHGYILAGLDEAGAIEGKEKCKRQIHLVPLEGLRFARYKAENGAMRTARRFSALAIVLLCLFLAGSLTGATGLPHSEPKANAIPPPGQLIDINHASLDQLLKAPGMTRSWAARIVRFRPYRTKLDLVERGVVSGAVYGRFKDYVIAHREAQ